LKFLALDLLRHTEMTYLIQSAEGQMNLLAFLVITTRLNEASRRNRIWLEEIFLVKFLSPVGLVGSKGKEL
jgi:hypothetical protein